MSSSADMLSDVPLGGNGAKKRNERRMGHGPNGAGSNGGGSQEESKRNLGYVLGVTDIEDAMHYQEILDHHDDISSSFVFFVDKYSDEQI